MDLITTLIALLILMILLFREFKGNKKSDNIDLKKHLIKFSLALENNEKNVNDQLQRNREDSNKIAKENRIELSSSLERFDKNFNENIKSVKESIYQQLKEIREDNTKQLEKMRDTVDEKLQKTLEKRISQSFKQVSERLEEVHKGLGEMQNIASGVGDLKKVLSNVKTRGVFGEYQLENILEQILTSEQYSKNVATKAGSKSFVEFAIKLPGKDSDENIWLPVDSKFPIESYSVLNEKYESGDKEEIKKSRSILVRSIDSFAKEISSKYIDPPNTTDFAIMFLPIEGLYAEVLKEPGLLESLRDKYKITITGPTTFSALLNSLQMGFRTLAVQKRSSEVWKILEAVKTEFNKFGQQLEKVDKQLNTASKSLNDLRLTRTNAINRKMRDVITIDEPEAEKILDIKIDN
tara:strand:- start:990 stop:2213 length:1224 start_codon:yes stop_codon:yes gene_type:complete